jgi:aminocarboxymuconate-semialdehyde decarboxylase
MTAMDVHSHVIPTGVVEAMTADPDTFSVHIETDGDSKYVVHNQGFKYPLFGEFTDPAQKLEAMDRKSIGVSVLSPPPTLFYYGAPAKVGLDICHLINDGIAEFTATHPTRFRGMGIAPMQDAELAAEELERVVNEYGFRSVEIGTSVEGAQLAEDRFKPFFERAEKLGTLVFTHPYYVGSKQGLEDYYLTNLLGNPWDSTVMISHLLFGGTLDEFPNLKLCVAHGGGFAPYQIGRLQHGHEVRTEPKKETRTPPLDLLRRLTFDTVVFNPLALRYLLDLVGADHVLLGSDAPFDMGDEDPVATLDGVPGLTGPERELIMSETVRSLLGEVAV